MKVVPTFLLGCQREIKAYRILRVENGDKTQYVILILHDQYQYCDDVGPDPHPNIDYGEMVLFSSGNAIQIC